MLTLDQSGRHPVFSGKPRATRFRYIAGAQASSGNTIPGAYAITIDGREIIHGEAISVPALLQKYAADGIDVSAASRDYDAWLMEKIFDIPPPAAAA